MAVVTTMVGWNNGSDGGGDNNGDNGGKGEV